MTLVRLSLCASLVALAAACDSDPGSSSPDSGANPDGGQNGDLSLDLGPGDDTDGAVDEPDVEDEPDAPVSETLGDDCFGESDCSDDELCVGADTAGPTPGYCTILDCADDDECEFGRDDDVFCCSNFGEFRGCFRELEGAVCGEETGRQGDDCSQGGQSDCAGLTHACIGWYDESLCAAYCTPGVPGACGNAAWCLPTGGGGGVCVPAGNRAPLEPCADDPAACGEGALCDGGFQDPPDPWAFCASMCTRNRDCTDEEWCRVFPGQTLGTCLPTGDGASGDPCVEDRFSCAEGLFCLNDGTRMARCTALCEREADCGDDFYCNFFSEALGTCVGAGDGDTGDPCGHDPFSCVENAFCVGGYGTGYNPDAYCSEDCMANAATCGSGFSCENLGDATLCLPDGELDAGDPCTSPLACAAETACIYDGDEELGRCQPLCSAPDECGGEEWCATTGAGDDGFCLPDGGLEPGDACGEEPFGCPEGSLCLGEPAYCAADCTDSPGSCPSGSACSEPAAEGARRFCVPFGDTAVGDTCTDNYQCEPDAFCAFRVADGPGVCTVACDAVTDCPEGLWCLRSRAFSACVPFGSADAGESCAVDRTACSPGLLCVFHQSDDAFCATDCTGFADRCDDGEVCRWLGNGLSACLPFGESGPGADCGADPTLCDAASLCLGAGTETAACTTVCSFDAGACTGDVPCAFFDNGLGVCTDGALGEPPL